jgi:CRISPR-associated protein Csb1
MTTTTSDQERPCTTTPTKELLDQWATDPKGPVALHLKQKLLPVEAVEGEDGIIFPPTYADIGYNIDTLSDDTKVAVIDSVGSQANRMEPIFKEKFKAPGDGEVRDWLVPQIEIVLHSKDCGECETCKKAGDAKKRKAGQECKNPLKEKRSLLELAHRSADAVVQSSPSLLADVSKAFVALKQSGDAAPLCSLAPTSLVFGVWDSRGGTGEKRPRLVRAIIRAWDVEPLYAAAQFNSVWKALDEDQRAELEKEAKAKKTKLSEKGLADAPAVFRKTEKTPKFRGDGVPNPAARVLGGVLARGRIDREVTVNLVALRGLRGKDSEETKRIQKYLLGLSLLAATADIDLFLREGCNLRHTSNDIWYSVPRRGEPTLVDLGSDEARSLIESYASTSADHFRSKWPQTLEHVFDLNEAKKLLAKKDDENTDEE